MALYTDNLTPISAVGIGTTTSTGIDISKREQVSFQFIAGSITSGNGVFSVDASNDGTNWVAGIAFQDSTSANSTTWVTAKTLSSNTTVMGFLPMAPYRLIRYKVVASTDGVYSVVHEAAG